MAATTASERKCRSERLKHPQGKCFFILSGRVSRNPSFCNSHCQTTIRFQPSSFSCFSVFLSRSTFRLNFSCQNSTFVDGVVVWRHPGCRCQKHPRTSITVLYFDKTISGCPGRTFTWSWKRNPCRKRNERTTSSGFVSSEIRFAASVKNPWI